MSIITKLFGKKEEEFLSVDDIYTRMGLDLNKWDNEERKAFTCNIYGR